MAPGKNTCVQGSHSWGRSPVGVQVVIRSLQVFLKALSTATVTPVESLLAGFPYTSLSQSC